MKLIKVKKMVDTNEANLNITQITSVAKKYSHDVDDVTVRNGILIIYISGKAYGDGYDFFTKYKNGKLHDFKNRTSSPDSVSVKIAEAVIKQFHVNDLSVIGSYD